MPLTEAIRNLQRTFIKLGLTPPTHIHLASHWQGVQLADEVEEWMLKKGPADTVRVSIDGTEITWPAK